MRFVRRAAVALTVVTSMLALSGCASGTEPEPGTADGPTTAATAAEREPGTADGPTTAATAAEPDADEGSSEPDGVAGDAPCHPAAFLPVLKQFDDPDLELVVDDVEVASCRSGYARVFAIPRKNPVGHPQHEAEQVFLRDVAGVWEVVESGTGISCDDRELSSQVVEICEGLGER